MLEHYYDETTSFESGCWSDVPEPFNDFRETCLGVPGTSDSALFFQYDSFHNTTLSKEYSNTFLCKTWFLDLYWSFFIFKEPHFALRFCWSVVIMQPNLIARYKVANIFGCPGLETFKHFFAPFYPIVLLLLGRAPKANKFSYLLGVCARCHERTKH